VDTPPAERKKDLRMGVVAVRGVDDTASASHRQALPRSVDQSPSPRRAQCFGVVESGPKVGLD
jgi:hypothetical protein